MTPNTMPRAFELFYEALKRSPHERSAYLAHACGDDASLREEVQSLLEHDEKAGEEFLRPPRSGPPRGASDVGETLSAAVVAQPPQQCHQIPGYEITREISHGGQGVVYEAIQKSTKQRVAIKLLRDGGGASRMARRRFEREIELVAQLRHPNIISIFDSGFLENGARFYVMDYVHGDPLDHFVRVRKLSLEDTLRLFVVVCDAVQHAHQKGVIHRDIKPSNVLIDRRGVPRILDFGLAKPLGAPAETLVSVGHEIIGTLPYMSPEQAGGRSDEIDIRTDVYSLGVVLYQLLTGKPPYPVDGRVPDVLRHISETQPASPTRSWDREAGVARRDTRRLRFGECPIDGEIETVVLKALSKERERRYQSAGELARDIRHYLAGEPIEARADSPAYVLWKQSRRYLRQTPVAALALLCAILGPGLVVSLLFWRQAALERNVAESVVTFLNEDVFRSLDPERVGRDVDLRVLLDNASQQIGDRFERMPLAEASIRYTLGGLYSSLGEDEKAIAHLRGALRLRRTALGDRHGAVAEVLVALSRALEAHGQLTEAESRLREALAIRTSAFGRDAPATIGTLRELAAFIRRQGDLEMAALLLADAEKRESTLAAARRMNGLNASQIDAAYERLHDLRETYGRRHPAVATELARLAELLIADARHAEAEPLLEESLSIWSELLGPEHARVRETFKVLEEVYLTLGSERKLLPMLAERLDRALADGRNPRLLADAAWDVIKSPDRAPDLVARARDAAALACALVPDNGAYLNTLGAAQYRSGEYEGALATLTRSDELNDGHPADVAFLAMTHWRLDREDAARTQLERLERIMQREPWSTNAQSVRLQREAALLIQQ